MPGTAPGCLRTSGKPHERLLEDDFVNHFADVDPANARTMYAVQQPLAWSAPR
jgi:hypothetical protein